MELATAIDLIRDGSISTHESRWADLGAGSGLFTRALSTLIVDGSSIVAVDRNARGLHDIITGRGGVRVSTTVADMEYFNVSGFDGVLMANSLHFIRDQAGFISSLHQALPPTGRILLVEYDTDRGNQWVPFPLSFMTAEHRFLTAGYRSVKKLHMVPSRYGQGNIYSALVLK